MIDFNMDCRETKDGWFEFKGYADCLKPPAERDMSQSVSCNGTTGGMAPYKSVNHIARCGYMNVFKWEVGNMCIINDLSTYTTLSPTPTPSTTATKTPPTLKPGWQRTVVLVQAPTQPYESLFLIGGIGHEVRKGTSECFLLYPWLGIHNTQTIVN